MTDDLVKKLRERGGRVPKEAADRIEELERDRDDLQELNRENMRQWAAAIDRAEAADATVQALVAAVEVVREQAAQIAKRCVYQYADPVPPILALGDPDAHSALSRLLAEARVAALEEAAKVVLTEGAHGRQHFHRSRDDLAAAIRALKEVQP